MQILNAWEACAADLHERYGVDVDDDVLMLGRSWFWLKDRILALLATPPVAVLKVKGGNQLLLPATRLQWALNPPKLKE